MIRTLGFTWAMSLLAFISLAFVPVPWLLAYYGPTLRAKSHYVQPVQKINPLRGDFDLLVLPAPEGATRHVMDRKRSNSLHV